MIDVGGEVKATAELARESEAIPEGREAAVKPLEESAVMEAAVKPTEAASLPTVPRERGLRAADADGRRRPDRADFFAIMFLARCRHELGDATDALLARADEAWHQNGLADSDVLFGVRSSALNTVSVDAWLILLMHIMIMEYNQILFAKRYRLTWGLREALSALRAVVLTPPPKHGEFNMAFHHSFYLATHIVYVQSAYNAIKASEREIPWLYRYVRTCFRYWMRRAKAAETNAGPYVDIDGVAEIIDCLRGVGLTEASDKMVCEGTLFMLRTQRRAGDWPSVPVPGDDTPEAQMDAYARIHPTWTCTQALRDRDFRVADNQFWPDFIQKLLKETKFHKLLYKPTW